jgi:DNA-binding CsgD family transcriptional regulator
MLGNVPRDASPAFIGRQAELDQLEAAWRQAVRGEPRLVLIGGDAGIGKTRLLREYLARPAAERVTAVGACVPVAGGSLPYLPFTELLRTLALADGATYEPTAALDALAPTSRAELARLAPALRLTGAAPASMTFEQDESRARSRLFEAVLTYLLEVAAQAPLLLGIEDLHWADGSSRDLLSYLIRNVRTEPILVLATYRTDELHRRHPLRPWAAEMSRLEVTERLELHPLADEDLRGDIADMLGPDVDPTLADRIVQRAEGNPLFAIELVASVRHGTDPQPLPETLRDGFLERVERLGPDARRIARAAAILGRPASELLLEDVTGLAPDPLATGIHEALDAQVLVKVQDETQGRFEPRHALLGEAIVDDLLPGERTMLHRRIADVLEGGADGDDEPARIASEIAHHRWEAHDTAVAVAASVWAAVSSAEARAYAEADVQWALALEAWPDEHEVRGFDRPAALLEAALCADNLGDTRRAADLAAEAVARIDGRADPLRAALARRQLGMHLSTFDIRGYWAQVGRAARLVEAVDAPADAARILSSRAVVLRDRLQFERAELTARRALALNARSEIPSVEQEALGVLGWCRFGRSEHAAAIDLLARSFDLALQLDDPRDYTLINAGFGLCTGLNSVGRWTSILEVHDRYQARSDELGLSRLWGWWLHDCLVAALLGLGRWREAESATAAMLAELGVPEYPEHGAIAAVVWARRGRIEEAVDRAAIAATDRNRAPIERLAPTLCLHARAEVALAKGDWAVLRDTTERAFRTVPARMRGTYPDLRPFVLFGLQAEAELAFEARIRRDAKAEAEALDIARELAGWLRNLAQRVTEAGEPLAATTLADAAVAEAQLTRVEHRSDPGAWRLALERCEGVGNPYDIARARHWLAASLLERAGSRSEAASELTLALTAATELGAVGFERQIRDLARRARLELGDPGGEAHTAVAADMPAVPETDDRPGPSAGNDWTEIVEPLTPREREVLGFVAAGWTNRRIGEALFISDKTVSVHVSNLMGKLGATNRAEAALIGDRLGLAVPMDQPRI